MKRILFAFLLFTAIIWAQPLNTPVQVQPDCGPIFVNLTITANSANFDNRFMGCDSWSVSYTSTGFATLSLIFQDAPDNLGVPGTWATYGGVVVAGINPNTAIDQASTIFKGYFPWLRLRLNAVTGSGQLRGTFFGYRSVPTPYVLATVSIGAVTANQGTPNTAGNRWPVYLSDGAAPQGVVANPFFARLSDGANPQGTNGTPLMVRLSNGAIPYGSLTDPLPTGTEYLVGASSTWTPAPACQSRAVITIAGAGTTEIVALSGTTQIRICHLSLGMAGATNITLVQGTGVNCATGPANITGAYTNILGLALDLEGRSIVTAGAGQAVCVTNSAAVAGGGFVTYTQY